MGEIVNLRRVKKRRRQEESAEAARENRVRHGRSGAQKAADRQARERQLTLLEGARMGAATPDE